MVSSTGVASCVEAKTGHLIWQERMGGAYSASPIYANGRIYFFNHEGTATVVLPGRKYTVIAVNKLDGEDLMASPAVAGKALFVRTRTDLYRIEQRD